MLTVYKSIDEAESRLREYKTGLNKTQKYLDILFLVLLNGLLLSVLRLAFHVVFSLLNSLIGN
jgi:hypothetical protein